MGEMTAATTNKKNCLSSVPQTSPSPRRPATERHALLDRRRRPKAPGQYHASETLDMYDTAKSSPAQHPEQNLSLRSMPYPRYDPTLMEDGDNINSMSRPRNTDGYSLCSSRTTVRLVLLGTAVVAALGLVSHRWTAQDNLSTVYTTTTTALLRSSVDNKDDPDERAATMTASMDTIDRTLEQWGAWLEPADDIRSGSVWKESAPALYHVWRRLQADEAASTGETDLQEGTRRQLKASSNSTETSDAISPTTTTLSPVAAPTPTAPSPTAKKPHSTSSTTTIAPPTSTTTGTPVSAESPSSDSGSDNNLVETLQTDEKVAQGWVTDKWHQVSDGAEHVWNATVDEEQTLVSQLQNVTSSASDSTHTWTDKEKDWAHGFVSGLHHLGDVMRSWWSKAGNFSKHESSEISDWWNHSKRSLAKDERIVQHKFSNWWNHTSAAEKVWWAHTRQKFRSFAQNANEKEHVWWNITRDTAQRDWGVIVHGTQTGWNKTVQGTQTGWDKAVQGTQAGWNKTVQWEHKVVDQTSNVGHRAWNASATTAVEGWDWTVDEEQKIWHAIQHWYNAHATYEEELAMAPLYFNTTDAFSLLTNAYRWFDYSQDFFHLQDGWDTQMNQGYCSVATVAAVLNSFPRADISLPTDPTFSPYPYATQTSLLNSSCADQTVLRYNASYDGVFHAPGGLSLDQTESLFHCYLDTDLFDIQTVHVDPEKVTLDEVRQDLQLALKDPDARVMINFSRNVFGQVGTGHFSPIGAYTSREDSFLVMDVAKYKYPPVWVTAARLYASLATVDKCGDWDYPDGQDRISAVEVHEAWKNKTVYKSLLEKLNCSQAYRGYIIVKLKR